MKSLFARVVYLIAGCVLVAGIAVPLVAQAQTTNTSALAAEIAQLQQLLSSLQSGASTSAVSSGAVASGGNCPTLFRSLSSGMSGSDVASLQTYLMGQGYFNATVTGYFGLVTQTSVQQWQSTHGVVSSGDPASTGWGVVGGLTRVAIANACADGSSSGSGSVGSSGSSGNYSGSSIPSSCPIMPQPSTSCSTGWQAQTNQYGCTMSYTCTTPGVPICASGQSPQNGSCVNINSSLCPVGQIFQNGSCISSACPAIAISCPYGEQVVYNGCAQSCVYTGTGNTATTFTVSPTSGPGPLVVTFSASQLSGFQGIVNFNDGTSATINPTTCTASYPSTCIYSVSHTYYNNGTYTGSLVQTNAGNSSNLVGTVTVVVGGSSSSGTVGMLTITPNSGTAPLTPTLSANLGGTYYSGGVQVTFGDGSSATLCNAGTACGIQSIAHTYTNSGTYTASVIANQNGTNTTLSTATVSVTAAPTTTATPSISVSESPSNVLGGSAPNTTGARALISWSSINAPSGTAVQLWLTSSSGTDEGIIALNAEQLGTAGTYQWSVPGPNCTTSGTCPAQTLPCGIQFINPGSYYVVAKLYQVPIGGLPSSTNCYQASSYLATSQSNTFTISKGSGSLSVSVATGTAPLAVTFTATNLVSGSGYTFTWGDSSSATQITASATTVTQVHTYAAAGTYLASLSNSSSVVLGTTTVSVSAPPTTTTGAACTAYGVSYPNGTQQTLSCSASGQPGNTTGYCAASQHTSPYVATCTNGQWCNSGACYTSF